MFAGAACDACDTNKPMNQTVPSGAVWFFLFDIAYGKAKRSDGTRGFRRSGSLLVRTDVP